MVSGFISATTSFALATIKLRGIFFFFVQIKTATNNNKKNLIIYILTSPLTDYRIFTESTSLFLISNLVIKKNICFISLLFAFHLDALKSGSGKPVLFSRETSPLSLCVSITFQAADYPSHLQRSKPGGNSRSQISA